MTKFKSSAQTSVKPKVASCRFCQKGLVTAVEIAAVRCDACAPWVEKELLVKLHEWRTIQAGHEEVAEFLIFTDATLRAIAEVGDLAQSLAIGIAGVTEVKVEKYQSDFAALFSK